MCTVLLAWRWRAGEPAVLAANRDELVSRPTDPPMRLSEDPTVFGGRDRLAGGTWLAVDPLAGRLCAVTNRHLPGVEPARDPTLRSRGEIPLLVLLGSGPLDASAYNPVNVLSVSSDEAWWTTSDGDGSRRGELSPGVHVVCVTDVDDPASQKTARLLAAARAAAEVAADADDLEQRFQEVLRSHETDGDEAVSAACIHGDEYGTVSSSTVVLRPGDITMTYADGRPCVTPYEKVVLA